MSSAAEFSSLQQAKAYDLRTLGDIYDRYSPVVYRCVYRVLNDMSLAEECVAEVFSQLLHALGSKGGHVREVDIFLMRAAMAWVDARLHNQIQDEQSESDSLDASVALSKIEPEDVRQALRKLSAEGRTVLLLKFLESWDDQQIAGVIAIPANTLHDRYKQALEDLRRTLKLAR